MPRDRIFNDGWKFCRDSLTGAEQPGYDDSQWLTVDLPHDWSIKDLPGDDTPEQIGPFSRKSPGNGNSTGHVIGGTGWYRKTFTIDRAERGKTAILSFDGVYMETEVWVNGKKAGEHKNGYTPFWFDITPLLNKSGEKNIVALKVDNQGRNSRWYSGSGIYRNVHLTLVQPLHVAVWGVYVTTPEVSRDSASVDVEITLRNDGIKDANASIEINVIGNNGKPEGSAKDRVKIAGGSDQIIRKQINVGDPDLWSPGSPALYVAEILVKEGSKVLDSYSQTFGIRSIEFSAEKGFLLNGTPLELKGGCMHHDNGLLGSAACDRAEVRKVELMKAAGFNAIRCAHNPPSETFLDACDRLGMLVLDEFTDMWETYKNPQDYSVFFRQWWNSDLTDMIMRDRNHPAVIMWSIGNEIFEKSDTVRLRIACQLARRVRELDSTRPVTQAITGVFYPGGWETTAPAFDMVDVCGYNYSPDKFEDDHIKHPGRIMYSSESFPMNVYDYWKAVEDYPWVIGDFVWTSLDYLGEASLASSSYVAGPKQNYNLGNFSGFKIPEGVNIFDLQAGRPSVWPVFGAWCGDLDITGHKKPQMLYRDVIWGNSMVEINVHEPIPEGYHEMVTGWGWPREIPSWNWEGSEGKPLGVRVFTKAQKVVVELNGKVVGEKVLTGDDKCIASFEVPYQPGELKAITYENGVEVASKSLKTTGEPAALRLVADRTSIKADRNDLSFVTIEVIDSRGELIPDASRTIRISLEGNGEIIASGNADPGDMTSVNRKEIKTFMGRAQAIIRPYAGGGKISLLAESEGLKETVLEIVAR